jgi:hypothetical protein
LGARLRPERGSKSFLLLFFKKEDLSIACLPSPDCPEGRFFIRLFDRALSQRGG